MQQAAHAEAEGQQVPLQTLPADAHAVFASNPATRTSANMVVFFMCFFLFFVVGLVLPTTTTGIAGKSHYNFTRTNSMNDSGSLP